MDSTFLQNYGSFVCQIVTDSFAFLPSSPFTLSDLATQAGQSMPILGTSLIYDIAQMLVQVGGLSVAYKILKVLPGRF